MSQLNPEFLLGITNFGLCRYVMPNTHEAIEAIRPALMAPMASPT